MNPSTPSLRTPTTTNNSSLEAKIVVLGSQGVGKTSLVHRYVRNAFIDGRGSQSTVGASFLTKRAVDADTATVVRLQIWDTAGQERFRSISRLYYRGANAGVLCYDITDPASFEEMGRWLRELRQHLGDDVVLHVVGTKADVVAADPGRRQVPFERCIAYVAENLYPSHAQTQGGPSSNSSNSQGAASGASSWGAPTPTVPMASPPSARSSGFWGQDLGWDCCHEVSAKEGEGVEEVFRVITRKLVEQRNRRVERWEREQAGMTPAAGVSAGAGASAAGAVATGYFDEFHHAGGGGGSGNGSFRLGIGDKRRSWLGFPGGGGGGGGGATSAAGTPGFGWMTTTTTEGGDGEGAAAAAAAATARARRGGGCC